MNGEVDMPEEGEEPNETNGEEEVMDEKETNGKKGNPSEPIPGVIDLDKNIENYVGKENILIEFYTPWYF
jgi:hypothetical protein